MSTRLRGSFGWWLAGIAAVGLVARVAYVELFSSHLKMGLDSIWNQLISATIGSGAGFVNPGKYFGEHVSVATAYRPPLYPLLLAAVGRTFDGTTRTLQLSGCVVGVVTVVLVGLLGRRVAGATVGLCAAAMAALYPAFLAMDASLMSENLYVPLVTGSVLAVYRAIERPTVPRWALVGGLMGAAVLTRGDAIGLIVALMVPAAWFGPRVRLDRRVTLAAVSIVTCALVVLPWMIRNEERLGAGTVATLQKGTTLAGANCPGTYYGKRIGSWSFECTQRAHEDRLSEAELNTELQRDGRRYLFDHAERLTVVVPVRVMRLWGVFDPIGQARLDAVESRNVSWQVVSWLAYVPVAGLAVYGFVVLQRRRARIGPMLAVVIALTATAAAVVGQTRLRAAGEPLLLVAAATAVVHLVGRLRPDRSGRGST